MVFKNKNKDFVSITIFTFLTIVSLFLESICILIKGLKKGFLKKEVLSRDSKLGFDLDIIIKS